MAKRSTKRALPEKQETLEEVAPVEQAAPKAAPVEAPTKEELEIEAAEGVYQVIPGRILHYLHMDRPSVWAHGGEYVKADHPVLLEMIEQQSGKVNKVERLAMGKRVVTPTRSDVLNLLVGYKGSKVDEVAKPAEESGIPEID